MAATVAHEWLICIVFAKSTFGAGMLERRSYFRTYFLVSIFFNAQPDTLYCNKQLACTVRTVFRRLLCHNTHMSVSEYSSRRSFCSASLLFSSAAKQ
jgi:hypothetical protein